MEKEKVKIYRKIEKDYEKLKEKVIEFAIKESDKIKKKWMRKIKFLNGSKNKCKKHKIKKTVDLGGVLFCRKCLDEGVKKFKNGKRRNK